MSESTALTNVQEQLAAEAAAVQDTLNTSGAKFIQVNQQTGKFEIADMGEAEPPVSVVVLDYMLTNSFFSTSYRPGQSTPPECFAYGKDERTLSPIDESPDKQCDDCASCPLNQFGSDGAGKACKNNVVLAVLPADKPDDDIMLVRVSPSGYTDVKKYISAVSTKFNTPPIGVVSQLRTKEAGQGFAVTMNAKEALPNEHLLAFFPRREEAAQLLDHKPDFTKPDVQAAPQGKRR